MLATFAFADGQRACALGAPDSGWMANWLEGHTDRFRCLVSHDGEMHITSNYYSTEELWFPEWEFGGAPWERRDIYEKFSPGWATLPGRGGGRRRGGRGDPPGGQLDRGSRKAPPPRSLCPARGVC